MNDHQRGTSRSRPSSAAFPQGSANQDANQTPGGQWYYNPPAGQVDQTKNTQPVQSSSTMIGPTSTFYNPSDNLHGREEHGPYQQWLDGFNSGAQSQSHAQATPFQSQASYRRNQLQNNPQPQVQGSYQYLPEQYAPPSSMTQYAQPMPTSMPPPPPHVPVVESGNPNPPYTQQGTDVFTGSPFYSEMLTLSNTSEASTPDHGQSYTPDSTLQSYSNSPDPAFQQLQPQQPQQPPQPTLQQQQQQHQQQQQQQAYPAPPHQQTLHQTQQAQPRKANPAHLNTQFQQPQQPHFQRFISQSSSVPQPSTGVRSQQRSANTTLPAASRQQWSNETGFSNAVAGPSTKTAAPHTQPSKTPPQTQPAVQAPRKADPPAKKNAASTSAPRKVQGKRKRTKREEIADWQANDPSDSESESDDESGLAMSGRIRVGLGGLGIVGKGGKREKGARLPGACKHCKKLKMKCDFPPDDSNTCKRCKQGGHICVVEGRKPRTAPNKREYLLAQIRQKDSIIESLLKQLHNPYTATPLSIASYRMATSPSDQNNGNVLAWLDRLQSTVQNAGKKAGPQAFLDPQNDHMNDQDSDDEEEAKRAKLGHDDAGDAADGQDGSSENEKIQSALPDAHVPLGLIADLSLSNNRKSKKDKAGANDDDNDDNVGVANAEYFAPGPATDLGKRATLIEQHSPPEIIVHNLVRPEDVDKLFKIFYERVNPFISLLDPVLHTPASTYQRCPFLFTVICAISSRYYAEKSEIYPIAMHFAKHSAANALIDGWKSVELCQAYILMSIYAVPARRWEEDRSWLYTGLAIRIATDLNLHLVSTVKPQSERQEREIMNKTRVWMICFNLDRSTATQFGKPSTIKEDFIVRNAKDWYKKSQYNHSYDVHLCAYSALLQIVAKFHDEIFSDPSAPTGLNKKVDFKSVTLVHDQHLMNYHTEWAKRFDDDSDKSDPSCVFRCSLLPFLVSYSRLVMFSFGFQQAFQRGLKNEDRVFFDKCMESAKSVIEIMINSLAPSGYMRYAPDGHFVFASFASAFLLKLLRPETSSFLIKDQENEILDLIGRLISTLSSPKIAIDDRHTPKLYARFLASRLQLHRRDGATVGRLHTNPPPPSQVPPTGGASSGPAAGMNAFSISGRPSGGNELSSVPGAGTMDPVYTTEATFAGAGAITFSSDLDMTYVGGVSEEEMLATMQAIKNPDWWQNMMMPGFSWPEASPSPPANTQSLHTTFHSHIPPAVPGLQGGFGMFHSAQVMM